MSEMGRLRVEVKTLKARIAELEAKLTYVALECKKVHETSDYGVYYYPDLELYGIVPYRVIKNLPSGAYPQQLRDGDVEGGYETLDELIAECADALQLTDHIRVSCVPCAGTGIVDEDLCECCLEYPIQHRCPQCLARVIEYNYESVCFSCGWTNTKAGIEY